MSKESLVEVGTMLYHPTRKSLGWIVDQKESTNIIGWYTNYVVEWADGSKFDNLTKTHVVAYHRFYLDLQLIIDLQNDK